MFQKQEKSSGDGGAVRRWRCSVCGYIHSGNEPPETCPVCAAPRSQFVEIDADGKKIEPQGPAATPAVIVTSPKPGMSQPSAAGRKTVLERVVDLVLKHHLHPIAVHAPNGILPAVLVFFGIGVYFKIAALETAAYYNLIFVLVMLPLVLATGFIEWRMRYKGVKTAIFITKILCSLVVLAATNVLVFWRLIDPGVLAAESPYRLIYLGVAAGLLAAVGIAGHLGGKLVFGSRV